MQQSPFGIPCPWGLSNPTLAPVQGLVSSISLTSFSKVIFMMTPSANFSISSSFIEQRNLALPNIYFNLQSPNHPPLRREASFPLQIYFFIFIYYLVATLLRYYLYTTKFTLLKCTVQWFLVYSQSCTNNIIQPLRIVVRIRYRNIYNIFCLKSHLVLLYETYPDFFIYFLAFYRNTNCLF